MVDGNFDSGWVFSNVTEQLTNKKETAMSDMLVSTIIGFLLLVINWSHLYYVTHQAKAKATGKNYHKHKTPLTYNAQQ